MPEKLHPESSQRIGWHYVIPDDYHPIGAVINDVLSLTNSRRRARLILHEDAPRAWGVLTPEDAAEVASRLEIDPETGNFTDPKQGEFSKGIQRKLGLID